MHETNGDEDEGKKKKLYIVKCTQQKVVEEVKDK